MNNHAPLSIYEFRCRDTACPVRQDCTCWVRRYDSGACSGATLRQGWEMQNTFCKHAVILPKYP